MNEQEEIIDLRVFLKVFTGHVVPIILTAALAAAAGFALAYFVVPKHYVSEALMYVENSTGRQDESSININDITAAQKLVNTCQILFKSNYVFDELNAHFGGIYKDNDLDKMIKIESVNSTEVLRISVETKSPQESYDVANELVVLASQEFERILKNGSIKTVSAPTLPEKHTYPNTVQFTAVGGIIGFVLTYVIFLIRELLDNRVKPDDDLTAMYDLPVFAEILDFEAAAKSRYKYAGYSGYGEEYEDDDDDDHAERKGRKKRRRDR